MEQELDAIELCSGGGGQALGLEAAGFKLHTAVEIDADACTTLRANRPHWSVAQDDIREMDGRQFKGIDLLAAGVPCPPFSIAGEQLGDEDERDLFPAAVKIVSESKPPGLLLENVRGLAQQRFLTYRASLVSSLHRLGYRFIEWRVLNARDFGVPQLRPRFVLVAFRSIKIGNRFVWPSEMQKPPTVGHALADQMSLKCWPGANEWSLRAHDIAPTIVGGSKKHGGPDLGPTRARRAWRSLGVDGLGIADEPPGSDFPRDGYPKLTVRMVARLQGFPDDWIFCGRKTSAYRQVGNAFPPPVACAVGLSIQRALSGSGSMTGSNHHISRQLELAVPA